MTKPLVLRQPSYVTMDHGSHLQTEIYWGFQKPPGRKFLFSTRVEGSDGLVQSFSNAISHLSI